MLKVMKMEFLLKEDPVYYFRFTTILRGSGVGIDFLTLQTMKLRLRR